uniref:uncharacterized protein LOC114669925 n=1 Tax=Macaca mulatta TaxID=9544 RepID=UPI0010A21B26|nr:uncharacterized protein LOC114669925 [Macaca mulatta]
MELGIKHLMKELALHLEGSGEPWKMLDKASVHKCCSSSGAEAAKSHKPVWLPLGMTAEPVASTGSCTTSQDTQTPGVLPACGATILRGHSPEDIEWWVQGLMACSPAPLIGSGPGGEGGKCFCQFCYDCLARKGAEPRSSKIS